MKNQKGFSLIELLIVVVIIGIIAAIAIPNLLASRRSANEGSAISSLRTVHGAEMTYQSTTGAGRFATLTELNGAQLVDSALGAGSKSGYTFTMQKYDAANAGEASSFAVRGVPTTTSGVSATGTRNFAVSTEGVVAAAPVATAITLTNGSSTTAATFGTAAQALSN